MKNSTAQVNASPDLLRHLQSRQKEMIALVGRLVGIESPSSDKQAVDRMGAAVTKELRRLGAEVRFHAARDAGNTLQADFPGAKGKPVMLLGHLDTVYDVGTLATMPFKVAKGRLWGPGVFDMKGGIVQALYAIRALQELRGGLPRPVTVLLNGDEEVGSHTSRKIIERVAKKCAAVLVCEPAHGQMGALKTSRKGVGDFTIKVKGVAAHSGLDFDKGQSAVLELARQIERIAGFTDLKRGLTINVGIVRGGTRTNVVPERAEAEVDVRIARATDAAMIEKKLRSLKPVNRKCTVAITGGINRPPLERTEQVVALYQLARGIAAEMGFALPEAAVGGGSDGNFTAALRIPTLDGLGAVGEGAHTPQESCVIAELPRRAALLARLIESVPD